MSRPEKEVIQQWINKDPPLGHLKLSQMVELVKEVVGSAKV